MEVDLRLLLLFDLLLEVVNLLFEFLHLCSRINLDLAFEEAVQVHLFLDLFGEHFLCVSEVFEERHIFLVWTVVVHLAFLVAALEVRTDVIERGIDIDRLGSVCFGFLRHVVFPDLTPGFHHGAERDKSYLLGIKSTEELRREVLIERALAPDGKNELDKGIVERGRRQCTFLGLCP